MHQVFSPGLALSLGKFLGIPIYLSYFWFLFAAIAGGLFGIMGVCLIIAITIFVLMHEFGHSLMARKLGYETSFIIMTPIGGIAYIIGAYENRPKDELLITFLGPLVNIALAAIFWLLSFVTPIFSIFIIMNLVLGIFNLIPAYPMDGGRILRSGLAYMGVEHNLATKISAITSMCIAVTLFILAILFFAPVLMIVSMFVFIMAYQAFNHSHPRLV